MFFYDSAFFSIQEIAKDIEHKCASLLGWMPAVGSALAGCGKSQRNILVGDKRLGRHHRHLLVTLSVSLMVSFSLRGPGGFVTLVGQGLFDSARYPVRMILGTIEDSPTMPWNSSLEPGDGGAYL